MKYFDRHWEENFSEEIPITKKMEAQRFLQPVFNYIKTHGPIHILDAGCGDGVHIDVIANEFIDIESDHLFGLDVSLTALLASNRRQQGRYKFIQGDIGKLPFKTGRFGVVFSFGVLAYTPNPEESFIELCRVTRKGGHIGIWIYPKTSGLTGFLFLVIRKVCQKTGQTGCKIIANCIIPFLSFLPTRSRMSLANASWRQCRELVLVNIAPKQLYFPDQLEVEQWFAKNNVKIKWRDDKSPITLWGEKC